MDQILVSERLLDRTCRARDGVDVFKTHFDLTGAVGASLEQTLSLRERQIGPFRVEFVQTRVHDPGHSKRRPAGQHAERRESAFRHDQRHDIPDFDVQRNRQIAPSRIGGTAPVRFSRLSRRPSSICRSRSVTVRSNPDRSLERHERGSVGAYEHALAVHHGRRAGHARQVTHSRNHVTIVRNDSRALRKTKTWAVVPRMRV